MGAQIRTPYESLPEDHMIITDGQIQIKSDDLVWSPFAAKWRRPHDHEVGREAQIFYAVCRREDGS